VSVPIFTKSFIHQSTNSKLSAVVHKAKLARDVVVQSTKAQDATSQLALLICLFMGSMLFLLRDHVQETSQRDNNDFRVLFWDVLVDIPCNPQNSCDVSGGVQISNASETG